MGALFNIIYYSISNLFFGILLTAIGISLMFFLIQCWFSNSKFTPICYIIGGILFFFLSFQAVLLCGAITIKSYCEDIEIVINNRVKDIPSHVQLDQESSQQMLDQIAKEWPLIENFLGGVDLTGHTSATIAQSITKEIRSFMNSFILRRIGWSLLFVVGSAIIVIKTMEQTKRRQRYPSGYSSGRSRKRHYDD